MSALHRVMAAAFISVFPLTGGAQAQEPPVLTGDADTLWVTFGPDGPHALSLAELPDTEWFSLFYPRMGDGRPHDLLLVLGASHLVLPWTTAAMPVVIEGPRSRHLIRFFVRGSEQHADFSLQEMIAWKGEVQVDVPEVFELVNIVLAITDYGLERQGLVNRSSEYYSRVLEHFAPYGDHPLVEAVDFSDERSGHYFSFRDNSIRYEFRGDSLVNTGAYSPVRVPDGFAARLDLVEDFARVTGFREFYQANRDVYQQQIEEYRRKVQVEEMWSWLEERFIEEYESYRIVFSPLVGGNHETVRYASGPFRQTVMFIAGPDIYAEREFDPAVEEAWLGLLVFSEIDHNYVNPTTEILADKVAAAFADTDSWTSGLGGYNTPDAIFNEYMTWAVYLLYLRDRYEDEPFAGIRDDIVTFVESERGFPRFGSFADELLRLYGKSEREPPLIPLLFQPMLKWATTVPADDGGATSPPGA